MRGAIYSQILIKFSIGGRIICQQLNVFGVGGVRQTKMHTAEPFVPQPSASEVEVAIRKLKSYKSTGIDQIPAESMQAGG
jgi:hypothetical protein